MVKPGRILSVALILVVMGGLAWLALRSNEPQHAGHPLSFWLDQYAANSPLMRDPSRGLAWRTNAANAIRAIGARAVPALIQMARTIDSPVKSNLIVLLRGPLPIHPHTDREYHGRALVGFYVLGPAAKDAVPALTDLLRSQNLEIRLLAAESLGHIGPAAKPGVRDILPLLGDASGDIRFAATNALKAIDPAAAAKAGVK